MEAGDTFEGTYRLVRELGRGGHATVFLGEHIEIGQRVAIKVMNVHSERFTREGRVLAQLSSPHTVRLLAFGRTHDDAQYLISEWVDGESLTDFINRRAPVPWQHAVDITRQILESLDEAHRLDIIHRDVKPGNVMLIDEWQVKVLDFGVAKLLGDPTLTAAHEVLGTPRYMAPESLRTGDVSTAADVFAVGMLAHGMLTGRHPNLGGGLEAIVNRHLGPEPYLLPPEVDIPAPVRAWVDSLMAKDPAQRPADAGAALELMPADDDDRSRTIPVEVGAGPAGAVDAFAPTLAAPAVAGPPAAQEDTLSAEVRPQPAPTTPSRREARSEPQRAAVRAFPKVEAPPAAAWEDGPENGGSGVPIVPIIGVLIFVIGAVVVLFGTGVFDRDEPRARPARVNPLVPDKPSADSADGGTPVSEHTRLITRGIAHFENGDLIEALRIFHQIEQGSNRADKMKLQGNNYRERTIQRIVEKAREAAKTATTVDEIDAAAHEPLIAHSLYRADPDVNAVVKELRAAARTAENDRKKRP